MLDPGTWGGPYASNPMTWPSRRPAYERLWARVPPGIRASEHGAVLRAVLEALGQHLDAGLDDAVRRLNDAFVQTCAPERIAALGERVGVQVDATLSVARQRAQVLQLDATRDVGRAVRAVRFSRASVPAPTRIARAVRRRQVWLQSQGPWLAGLPAEAPFTGFYTAAGVPLAGCDPIAVHVGRGCDLEVTDTTSQAAEPAWRGVRLAPGRVPDLAPGVMGIDLRRGWVAWGPPHPPFGRPLRLRYWERSVARWQRVVPRPVGDHTYACVASLGRWVDGDGRALCHVDDAGAGRVGLGPADEAGHYVVHLPDRGPQVLDRYALRQFFGLKTRGAWKRFAIYALSLRPQPSPWARRSCICIWLPAPFG